jgi:predicted AlkP superfamily pyrophosphatase or phosphodiesterase
MKPIFLRALLCALISFPSSISADFKKPRLTVIMVIDQFAYSYLRKLSCYLKHGIKFLMRHGIFYENAQHPHGMPSTGPGHTALSTGCYAKDHGITANHWATPFGKKVACDDDDPKTAAVINPLGGFYDFGKGPLHIEVDTISDQFVLSQEPGSPRVAISLSIKSRAAVCTANEMGKAIWLDLKTGYFTSSKAYYDQLPSWLKQFNQQKRLNKITQISWPLFFPQCSLAYNFKYIDNYQYSTRPSIAGKTLPIDWSSDEPLELFIRTPAANQLLFDLAVRCVKTHVTRNSCQELMLWLCLSPLDMVGHEYGPYSREVIDMIYHLDCQIERFMDSISEYLKRTDILFVLTADHGVSPIPELLNDEGYSAATRINYSTVIPQINEAIKKKFEIDDYISHCLSNQLFVNEKVWRSLTPEKQEQSFTIIKDTLRYHAGVKKVWSAEELKNSWFDENMLESHFKYQMYPGRTGKYIIQPFPYCVADDHSTGTGHRTPYEPDTHVPLIIYQKGNLESRIIYEKVWTLQLAPSLAHILRIQRPSACTAHLLPGLIDYDPITGEVLQTVVL